MPTLTWPGKNSVLTCHTKVPCRKLTAVSRLSEDHGASRNMLVQGDSLEVLTALLPHYAGKIDCIYIDPPYNTGREDWSYDDAVNGRQTRAWFERTVDEAVQIRSRHDKWLCVMYPRIVLLHQLMSHNGLLFVSIDDIEVRSLYFLLTEIFGEQNFVADYAWPHTVQPPWHTGEIAVYHNHLIVFGKHLPASLGGFTNEQVGSTSMAHQELSDILGRDPAFETPKSLSLVTRVLEMSTNKDSIVLDCFAGSGTTGHATLYLNSIDEGTRTFILVEQEEHICENITAERLRSAIRGHTWLTSDFQKNRLLGLGGSFTYYVLGHPLLEGESDADDLTYYQHFVTTG